LNHKEGAGQNQTRRPQVGEPKGRGPKRRAQAREKSKGKAPRAEPNKVTKKKRKLAPQNERDLGVGATSCAMGLNSQDQKWKKKGQKNEMLKGSKS